MQPHDAEVIWRSWRRVVKIMSVPSLVWESFFAPSAWSQWGVDYVSGLRRNGSTQKVIAILGELSDADLRRAHAVAAINHRRLEAISRWAAVSFVTLPASAALVLNQLAPELAARFEFDRTDVVISGILIAWIGYVLMAAWRARQIVVVTELAMVERGVGLAAGDLEPEDPPLEPPIGA